MYFFILRPLHWGPLPNYLSKLEIENSKTASKNLERGIEKYNINIYKYYGVHVEALTGIRAKTKGDRGGG
jgi:hypothetical protein